jgi:hypothetical protein
MEKITLPESLKRIRWPSCADHGAMDINHDTNTFFCTFCKLKITIEAMQGFRITSLNRSDSPIDSIDLIVETNNA